MNNRIGRSERTSHRDVPPEDSSMKEDPTLVAPEGELPKGEKAEEGTWVTLVPAPDVIGDRARREREARTELSDVAWVKRILQGVENETVIPEEYVLDADLQAEMDASPQEGVLERRRSDFPPPPIFSDFEQKDVNVPKHVYVAGLRWEVGAKLGEGAFGKVFEVKHAGEDQRLRVVKFMGIHQGEKWGQVETDGRESELTGYEKIVQDGNEERAQAYRSKQASQASHARFRLWNEIGATLASGDYVGHEVYVDEIGNTWAAIVLNRHEGETYQSVIESEDESHKGPKWAYQQAMALRAILAPLRQMHAKGWIHGDIKPANLMVASDAVEASLARPIDYGLSEKSGVIRRKVNEFIAGTPRYTLPEMLTGRNADLRIQDYWASILSVAMSVGLIRSPEQKARGFKETRRIMQGDYFEAPNLRNTEQAEQYFQENGIAAAEKGLHTWLYNFLQPHMPMMARQHYWEHTGMTTVLDIPPLKDGEMGAWMTGEDQEVNLTKGWFLNDDRLISELEELIVRLAEQSGMPDPKEILDQLQEFPENQSSEARIMDAPGPKPVA